MKTPETEKDITRVEIGHSTYEMVGAKLARKLEVERDQALKDLKEMTKERDQALEDLKEMTVDREYWYDSVMNH
jgi:hypothetical protein